MLKSINLPVALQKIEGSAFRNIETLTELIIPDTLTQLSFGDDYVFSGTNLPLATQKRLRQLGYKGTFKKI